MDDVTAVVDRPVRPVGGPPKQKTRLTGIDVARGLAVLGMYAVHVGPDPAMGGVDVLFKPFEGHSAALFAVLAGVSIALMSGGRTPKTGMAQTKVSLRLGTRAPLLIALGLWLTNLDTGYMIILAYYGVCFLFAIPWLRFGVKALLGATLVAGAAFPLVSFLIRGELLPRGLNFLPPDVDSAEFTSAAGLSQLIIILLFTGTFPALNLMTYIFAGMAIGRMDLGSRNVCRRLFFGGTTLAVLGYLVSWVATDLLGGRQAVYNSLAGEAAQAGLSPATFLNENEIFIHGTPPTTSLAWQLLPTGSSYTPFDFAISIGIAAAVIGACQLLMPRFERVLSPLADLGGRVLSAYVLHFVVISLIWPEGGPEVFSVLHFVEFSVVALVAAVAWRRWIGRGPLEWAMHTLSKWPNYVLPQRVPARS
ncbi:DUF418 domain-containing protein [Amycolatopsis sp.]|uniref:DUF418 domain-containing protein n=1 Tax=Amycolatopsis sp. TaxID=37632 RepID=UPI002E022109|nr:DUF418 domain-containing protein [Amycolatopsis sp.]